jgi:hypothetical protein
MDDRMRAAAVTARLMGPKTTTLEALVGDHVLMGVDFGRITIPGVYGGDEADTCVFVLDHVAYTVTEDPSDGYRSHMDSIRQYVGKVSNMFQGCPVRCAMRAKPDPKTYSTNDNVLEMHDVVTGNLVLAIGTTNTDDYYPCYLAHFDPTAMHINSGVR